MPRIRQKDDSRLDSQFDPGTRAMAGRKMATLPKTALTMRRPASKTSYHHGNLREALIDAGLGLLESEGAAALSLRQLARHVGVSQAAPYHHFPDKNGLLAALAAEGFRRAASTLRAATLKHPTLERRVRGLMAGYVRFAQDSPELFRLMYGPVIQNKNAYPELVDAASDGFEALAERVQEMIDDFGLKELDTRLATVSLLGLNHGLAHLIVDDRGSPMLASTIRNDRTVIEHAANMFVRGFRPSDEETEVAVKARKSRD